MKTRLPNFLIVGAAKSGTTSLYQYLKQHPDIYLPSRKECRYFSKMSGDFKGPGDDKVLNNNIVKTLSEYRSFFSQVVNERAIGDISPDYLYYYEKSITNIKNTLGNEVKILIILRNPIERAYSNYLHFLINGRESLPFEGALEEEKIRKSKNWEWAWYYKDVGFYYNQVKAYIGNFSRIKIFLFDDFKSDTAVVVKSIFEFIEVDPSFVPNNIDTKFYVSGIPKNKLVYKFLYKPNLTKKFINLMLSTFMSHEKRHILRRNIITKPFRKPQMKPETGEYLRNLYRGDILKLQDMIDRDLSHWLR